MDKMKSSVLDVSSRGMNKLADKVGQMSIAIEKKSNHVSDRHEKRLPRHIGRDIGPYRKKLLWVLLDRSIQDPSIDLNANFALMKPLFNLTSDKEEKFSDLEIWMAYRTFVHHAALSRKNLNKALLKTFDDELEKIDRQISLLRPLEPSSNSSNDSLTEDIVEMSLEAMQPESSS